MEKTFVVVIICSITAFLLGLYLGREIPQMKSSLSTVTEADGKGIPGVYTTSSWNGKQGTLALNKDMSCVYPNGHIGTWYIVDEQRAIIMLDGNRYEFFYNDNVVVLHDHVFTKVK